MIRVLIVNKDEVVGKLVRKHLSEYSDIVIVDVISDEIELLKGIVTNKVDVAIDIYNTPKFTDTCDTVIKEKFLKVRAIVATAFVNDSTFNGVRYGIVDYCLDKIAIEDIYKVIITANEENIRINSNIFARLSWTNQDKKSIGESITNISRREWHVIQEISKGLSNKEIADKLYLSEGTVRNYLSSILAKLDLRDRTQLAIWALKTGVVS